MSGAIRSATDNDAEVLTDLAIRSKGHWGYDLQFLEDCRAELTMTVAYLRSHPVFVLEEKDTVVGFYSLQKLSNVSVELVHLFVEPNAIGCGHGKRLWLHAVETARQLGFHEMTIHSDPFAEAFYQAMGAIRVGETTSSVRSDRKLPLLRFRF